MIGSVELTIVGAGAIGGLIGAHLWRAGHPVRLVERDVAHATAIRDAGLEVAGHAAFVARVPRPGAEAVTGPIGMLVLAVKTPQTEEALAPLVRHLAPDGCVVSMQNGLEEERIAALVGRARTAAAFLSFGGHYERPGRVVYSGPGTLRVGELDGRLTPRVIELARILSDFHTASATGNIVGCRWGSCSSAPSTSPRRWWTPTWRTSWTTPAPAGCSLGWSGRGWQWRRRWGLPWRTSTDSIRAACAAARASRRRRERRGTPTARTGAAVPPGRTGIWRDLAVRKRRTEAGPILGALIAAAERAGRPVPRVRAMLARYPALEAGAPREWANLEALASAAG